MNKNELDKSMRAIISMVTDLRDMLAEPDENTSKDAKELKANIIFELNEMA